MKWIKASERLPDDNVEPGSIIWRTIVQKTVIRVWSYWTDKHLELDDADILKKPVGTLVKKEDVEWLDEQGDAIPADLEQRAKEWVKQHESWVPDEQSEGAMFNAFLAGAAYGKGGEEGLGEGLTKEQIAQICEMADNDYAGQEAIVFAEWVRDEQYTQSLRNLDKWYKVPAKERTEYYSTKDLYELFKLNQKEAK